MASQGMWERFRQRSLERLVYWIRQSIGRDVPVEIDWDSLGEDPGRDESLEYDLEMLARGLEGDRPLTGPRDEEKRARICEGIERVHVRQVPRREDCRLEVADGTLHVDFCWPQGGRFSPREIEALLLDRGGRRLATWVTPPLAPLPPLLAELWRNRMPGLYAALEDALRRSVPVHVDWPSLAIAPDAAHRLAHMLDALAKALRPLADPDPGMVVGPQQVHERARRKAAERCAAVEENIQTIKVRGASVTEEGVLHIGSGVLELRVFQDEGFEEPTGKRTVTEIRRFPGCTSQDLETFIEEALDLELAPLLRQVREEDFPKARAYLPKLLRELIADAPGGVRDRIEMKDFLAEAGIELEMDWVGLISAEDTDDKIKALRTLETGHYNYNCDYGELFCGLMEALQEAAREAPTFVGDFIRRVRKVRYEQVPDPEGKELIADGTTLVLRQCPWRPGGLLGHMDALAQDLIVTVAAMTGIVADVAPQAGEDIVRAHLSSLVEVLGEEFSVSTDQELMADDEAVERLRQRVLTPLVGAVRTLLDRRGYAENIRHDLLRVKIRHVASPQERGCLYIGGHLVLSCCPERGAAGCLAGDDLVRAIDDALGLHVRAEIARLERENRASWQRMLRERFDRDVPVEVDWASFLAHPVCGGNRLYPLTVVESCVMRLIYALTGWMDGDAPFKAAARERVQLLRVTCAADVADRALLSDDDSGTFTHRCLPDTSLHGCLTIDELQEGLHRLIPTKRERDKDRDDEA